MYEKAAKKNKNNIILFSIYQEKVIKQLKDYTKTDRKQYEKILKDWNITQSKANFRIRLFEWTERYQKLMYSTQSLRFFFINFKKIKEICQESGEKFVI